ncbi:MAG: non-ribosomal peptide synthetase [Anaerolineae bacterium]|nr:non-ribosomal peptide synthetase [Anaerolineae bacterium]
MALAYPQHIAVTSQKQAISYATLNEKANRLGHLLLQKNAATTRPIVLLLDHEVQICVGILGVIKSNHFYSALNPAHTPHHLQVILDDLQPSLLITQAKFAELADQLAENRPIDVIVIDDLDPELPAHNLNLNIALDAPLVIFYTSGSTGVPKGVMRSHKMMLHRLFTGQHKALSPLSSRIAMLQPCSLANSANDFYSALTSGNTLCFFNINEMGIRGFAQWLSTQQITHLHITIALLRQFLHELPPDAYFPDLREISPAGQILKQDLSHIWRYFSGDVTVISRYSASEAGQITRTEIYCNTPISGNVAPVGFAVPGYEITLVNEHDQPVPQGESGEIIVRSKFITNGYWNKPELTNKAITVDPSAPNIRIYRTGDWGRFDGNGCLEFLGRKDDRVKIRGFTVELFEVAAVVMQINGVKEAIAIAKEVGAGDKKLLCYWTATTPDTPLSNLDLRHAAAERLPNFMMPAAFIRLLALPLNSTGKIDRTALPDAGHARPELSANYVEGRTADEKQLAQIWSDVLQLDRVGIHDPFLDLGGNSLQAMRISSRVQQAFQVDIPPAQLLKSATVAQMMIAITQYRSRQIDDDTLAALLDTLDHPIP